LQNQTVQPDLIVLNIPQQYNSYSNDVELCKINQPNVIVNRCKEYGPATKLLGLYGTKIFDDMLDEDLIIVVNDDRNYNNRMIENFINYHTRYPNYALTVAGWTIETIINTKWQQYTSKHPRGVDFCTFAEIDVLGGCCGFLLTKANCPFNRPEIFELDYKDSKYYADDIWFSGFLKLNGINIFLIPNTINLDEQRNDNDYIYPVEYEMKEWKNSLCIEYFREMYGIWKQDPSIT
jgi:hypothetical protein